MLTIYLRNESHEDDHAHTRNDVCMVLDDKLMAEERRGVLVMRSTQHDTQLRADSMGQKKKHNVLINAHHHKLPLTQSFLRQTAHNTHTQGTLIPAAL